MALVRRKWNSFGRYIYYLTLLLYSIFLFCLTSFLITTPPSYSAKRIISEGANTAHLPINRCSNCLCFWLWWRHVTRLEFLFFLTNGPIPAFFVYFHSFLVTILITQIEKIVDGVLGIWTRGCRMVVADETMELWRPLLLQDIRLLYSEQWSWTTLKKRFTWFTNWFSFHRFLCRKGTSLKYQLSPNLKNLAYFLALWLIRRGPIDGNFLRKLNFFCNFKWPKTKD